MKWVKVAIGAVIAIISIGIVATSVYKMTQERIGEKVVTFEVLTETAVTSGTYNLLIDMNDNHPNASLKINGNITEIADWEYDLNINTVIITNYDGDPLYIYDDDTYLDDGWGINIGDILAFTDEVTQPPQLSGINATLILLAPLIFAGGVLAYLLNKQEA